jgi:hypothetical protein
MHTATFLSVTAAATAACQGAAAAKEQPAVAVPRRRERVTPSRLTGDDVRRGMVASSIHILYSGPMV